MAITFISYRREDSAGYAGRLHEELEQRLGRGQVFRDVDTLRPGQDFVDGISQRLRNCRTLVAMIGRTWLNVTDESGARRLDRPDDYVTMEIGEALSRPDVLVVPVLVGGAMMPDAQQLPERIRALARKQALVLRDETWEEDVDRLSAVLESHGGTRPASRPRRAPPVPRWAVGAAAVLIVLTLGFVALREPGGSTGGLATAPDGPAPAATTPGPSSAPASAPSPPPTGAATGATAGGAYAVDVIGNPEVAYGQVIYSVITGSVVDRGGSGTVWLRLRASNEGRTAVALSSDSFQLAADGETFSAVSPFSEVLPAFSLTQKLVSYELPTLPPRAQFRMLTGATVATIDLDLRTSGRPAVHDRPDTGDALSRATVSTLVSTPTPLLANGDLTATLLRVTCRRFANLQQLTATVRYENKGRYDQGTWGVVLHVVDGADVLPPSTSPSAAVRGLATYTGDSVFELPAGATSIQLRATADKASLLIPLALP
jgi:hypothetical protein